MEIIYVDYNIYMGSFAPQVMCWWTDAVSQFSLEEDFILTFLVQEKAQLHWYNIVSILLENHKCRPSIAKFVI